MALPSIKTILNNVLTGVDKELQLKTAIDTLVATGHLSVDEEGKYSIVCAIEDSPATILGAKEIFLEAAKLYPGSKDAYEKEWQRFQVKCRNNNFNIADECLLVADRVKSLIAFTKKLHEYQKVYKKLFVPDYRNFSTWLNALAWRSDSITPEEYLVRRGFTVPSTKTIKMNEWLISKFEFLKYKQHILFDDEEIKSLFPDNQTQEQKAAVIRKIESAIIQTRETIKAGKFTEKLYTLIKL